MQKNFVAYNSSAGTGKTFTLVKEYLKIALATDSITKYKHILAVTFTNKAASEMKERVLDALKAIAGIIELKGTPKSLLEELKKPIKEGGLGISEEVLQERSQKVLKSILHNYNDFAISTIDKFTHKVIRTFAHDLKLPLNFNIELSEKEVLKSVIDMLVAEVGSNEKLTKVLVEYALQKSEDEKSWSVEKDLFDFSEKLLKDGNEKYLEKIRDLSISDFEEVKKYLNKEIHEFETNVKKLGKEALAFIDEKGIEKTSFSNSSVYDYWFALSILKKEKKGSLLIKKPTATVIGIHKNEKNWYAKKVAQEQKNIIDENKAKLIHLFNESRAYIEANEELYLVHNEVFKNLYNIAVLNEIEKTIDEFKTENNILNLSDFNKRIAAIVATEPAPFIYERLGEKYQHYLIDEFQDTSTTQWHNMLPLVDNSLAYSNYNMVVGDAKQAIYRWRGGEVEQIIAFPKIYGHNNNPILLERQESIERNHKPKVLDKNYRSKAEIVDFTNQFFNGVSQELPEKYKKLYNDLNQKHTEQYGGGIEVFGFEGLNDKSKEDMVFYEDQTYSFVLTKIDECLKDNYELKDITILCRGNKKAVAVSEYLLKKGINVISSESLLLNNSKEVLFILNLLRYLTNPDDVNFQVKLMVYLTQFYNDELIENYEKGEFLVYLSKKGIDFNYKDVANYSLYELVEELIIAFNLNGSVNLYLQFFLDKVHEYASKNDNSILNFIEWWELKGEKFSVVIPDGIDAVQVMTIHKSKGLEFPVVIYPFADTTVKKGEDYFWTDDIEVGGIKSSVLPIKEELNNTRFSEVYKEEMNKSKLDLINLVYVAFTRPKDRLYISTKKGKGKSKNGSVGDYLHSFCSTKEDNKIGDFHYRFGAFNKNQDIEDDQVEGSLVFENTVYNNWRDKLKVSYQAPKLWNVDSPEAIGEQGTLIHNILSKIKTVSDLGEVLSSYQLNGLVSENEAKNIKQSIENLFINSEIKDWFEDYDELKNERSILLKNGESYQPDRVVVKNETTYVIDYKTGQEELSHKEQLKNYRNILVEMGYNNVIAKILYVNNGRIINV